MAWQLHAQVVNAYARVTNISGANVTISTTAGEIDETADTFDNGDYIIIMQMQDNVIGSTTNDATFGNLGSIQSAGLYEVRQIVSQVAGPPRVLTLDAAPTNTYNIGANSSVQIISFRRFGSPNYTSTSNMSALPWNGNIGGVLAIDVPGIFTLAHHLSADGAGFRGGAQDENGTSNWTAMPTPTCEDNIYYASFPGARAPKAEGIYRNTNNNYVAARGKMLNGGGGGNSHNGGGGGGGNFSSGGLGGWGWNCETVSRNAGGQGGISLNAHITINRVFMGGGGGAGERNNGFDSYGGRGGGIIILRANTLQTTGACGTLNISANGENAPLGNGHDGCGGGGAGGSIVFIVSNWNVAPTCPILVRANGGNGGNVNSSMHGGGGGGGQGVIFYASAAPSNVSNTTTAGAGGCNNNDSPCDRAADGENIGTNVFFNSPTPLPVELLYFYARRASDQQVAIQWAVQRPNITYFEVEKAVRQIRNFQTIGDVSARNTSQQENYQLLDNNFTNETSYYRLKVHFTDGKIEYSRIVAVSGSNEQNLVNIYPNPFEKEFWIENGTESIEKILVQDLWGRQLLEISQPKRVEKVSLEDYPRGTYLVILVNKEKTEIKRMVKF
ncbi:MAG: hypothetical protein Fur0027_16180 [Raineya sp.]